MEPRCDILYSQPRNILRRSRHDSSKGDKAAGAGFHPVKRQHEYYVRKDTFDAHMQRMEALMERNIIEQRAMYDRLEAKIDSVKDGLEAKIDGIKNGLDTKIDDINDSLEAKISSVANRLEAKIDGVNDRLEAKIDSVRAELKGDIKALDAKVYALEGKLSQNLVITGVITTILGIVITLIIAAIQFWK